MSQQLSTTSAVIGVDIGKNSFQVVGLDQRGAIVLRHADHLTATDHRAALHEGSARWPVAHTAPKGVSTAEALIAAG
jgi:hypothetical protein